MSVSAVGAMSPTWSPSATAGVRNRRQDVQSLSQALSAGDLASAQSAFAALQKDAPRASTAASAPTAATSNPIASDFAALGDSLQKGDMQAAKDAFAKLQQDMKAVHHGGHHHHGGGARPADAAPAPAPAAVDADGDTDGSTSKIDLKA